MLRTSEEMMPIPPRSTGSVSTKIEMFEKKSSPEKRAPSPGMAGFGTQRRPPSPGGIGMGTGPLTPISNKMSPRINESPRSRPMPGGGGSSSKGRPSPGGPSPGGAYGNQMQKKPSPDGGGKRRAPSPGGMNVTRPSRLSENIEPQRFVFSSEATGITPTNIQVSSQPPLSGSDNIMMNQDFHNAPESLGKKNNNPLRNNPDFMQKMSEAFDSDEEIANETNNELKKIAQSSKPNLDSDDETIDIPVKIKESDKFAQPAKHWVKLKPIGKNESKQRDTNSSDALVRNYAHPVPIPAPVEPLQSAFSQTDPVQSSDASVSSKSSRLGPGKRAVIDKLKKARGRKSKQSDSPKSTKSRSKSKTASPSKSKIASPSKSKIASPSKSSPNSSPRKIIRPSPVRATGPLFIPIRRNNGDDSSVSSYSTKSFSSAVYGKGGKDDKNGETLSQKMRRASSRSPMRKHYEEGIKNSYDKVKPDEHMSVKKGISLIQAHNKAAKKVEAFERKNKQMDIEKQKTNQSNQSISRVNSNLARLKALREEQRLREEEKRKRMIENRGGKSKYQYMQRKEAKKPHVADDEFTVDAEVLSIGEESKSTSSSDDELIENVMDKGGHVQLKNKPKNNSHWAEIMQNRMSEVGVEEESSFEDEFRQDDNWEPNSPQRRQKQKYDESSNHRSQNFRSQSPMKNIPDVDASESEIMIDDITHEPTPNEYQYQSKNFQPQTQSQQEVEPTFDSPPIQQLTVKMKKEREAIPVQAPLRNMKPPLDPAPVTIQQPLNTSFPVETNQSTPMYQIPITDYPDQNPTLDINPYIGAYANLLPRTTNPIIVRTSLPTVSSSLANLSTQPTPQPITPQENPIYSSYPQGVQVLPQPNILPASDILQNLTYANNIAPRAMSQQATYVNPEAQPMNPNPQNSINGFSSTQSSENPQKMKVNYGGGGKSLDEFALSNSTPDSDETNANKSTNLSKEESSTLLGQEHVPSTDSDGNWWENVANQDQDVSDAIKAALLQQIKESEGEEEAKSKPSAKKPTAKESVTKSTAQKKSELNEKKKRFSLDADSDEDVFHGLESPRDQDSRKRLMKAASDKELDSIFNDVTVSSGDSVPETKIQKRNLKKGERSDELPSVERASSRVGRSEDIPSVGRVSSKAMGRVSSRSASRNGIFDKFTCGVLDPMSSMDSPASHRRGKNKRRERRRYRDDDTYDEGTYFTNDYTADYSQDYTNDYTEHSGDSRTFDSRMDLSANEQKVWDSWDRKDSQSSFTGASGFDRLAMSPQQREENNERRSRAHEKLLMHAYIALSKPPPEVMREKEDWRNEQQAPFQEKQTIGQYSGMNHQHQETIADGPYVSDAENQVPPSYQNNRHHMPQQSRPMTSNSQALENLNNQQDNRSLGAKTKEDSLSSGNSNPASIARQPRSIAYQKHVLEKFCVRIKHMAVEVLKLNRDNKWQTRYLTVSKEGTWLKNNAKSDACFCPLGLLWVKKFNKSREHSVLTIDKQGRGGMLLANLIQVSMGEDSKDISNSVLTKNQMKKFHDSCIVKLQGQSSFVTLRCERNDADAILIGCNAIIDVLRGSNNSSSASSAGSVMRPQSSLSMNGARSVVSHALSKTYVANDLWEA